MGIQIHAGEMVWYAAGQFYVDEHGRAFDVGFFTNIKGIEGPFFKDATPLEPASAYFTFSAIDDPFTGIAGKIGKIPIMEYPKGDWKLFLKVEPGASFDDPASFSNNAEHIATFRREVAAVSASIHVLSASLLSFRLTWSKPFTFHDQSYDLKNLIPYGVTQIGDGEKTPLPPIPHYPNVSAFLGSAFAIGGPVVY